MTKAAVLHHIREVGVVPVLRASSAEEALAVAEAIAAGGIPVIEVTMTVPNAIEVIRTLVRRSPKVLVGAGTVLDADTARRCRDEGAQFIVSPATDFATLEFCQREDLASMPGALTPTEIVAAWRAGADVIKVFPASAMGGPGYLRSLKAPLPQIELLPSGGVKLGNVADYLAAGAFALGAGVDLVDCSAIAEGKPERVTAAASAWCEVVRQHPARR